MILAVAVVGTTMRLASPSSPAQVAVSSPFAVYLQIAAVQALLIVYVARVGRGRWRIAEIMGRTWADPTRAVGDFGWAMGATVLILALETGWRGLAEPSANAAARALAPHTAGETVTWLGVALVVGFAEEMVYRGYLQPQLSALTRSTLVGCALSACLFGVAHLEQGLAAGARAAVYGLVFGVVALARGSVVPGIVAHVVIDALAGLLAA